MSAIITNESRGWILGVGFVLATFIATAGLTYLLVHQDASAPGTGGGRASSSTASGKVAQAPWELTTRAISTRKRVSKEALARVEEQTPALRALLTDVYDGLFFEPSGLEKMASHRFGTSAGKRLLQAKIAFPDDIRVIRATSQHALLGIEASGAKRASAEVTVRLRARTGTKRLTLKHRSTLWLSREHGGWRIIGFDISQGPR